jgi:hypothetical protein
MPKRLAWQFGLRALLAITLAAALCVWWAIQPPKGMITDRQAAKIKTGMTLEAVQETLAGSMCEVGLTSHGPYTYRIHRPFGKQADLVLYVDPVSDRVHEVAIH